MSPFSQETQDSMRRFGQAEYDEGYRQGLKGIPYRGRTFIGYYGWLDGNDRREKVTN